MKNKYYIFIVLCLFFGSLPALNAEISGARYLLIAPGSRPNAMGEAFTAVADDSNAIYWNAAGLGFLTQKEISFTHTKGLVSNNLDYLTYIHPLPSCKASLGASLFYLSDSQWRTSELGEFQGEFRNTALTAILSCGKKMNERISAGINIKILQQSLDSHDANAYAVDAGFLYKQIIPQVNIGLSLQNLGTKMKFIKDEFSLPGMANAGIAYQPAGGKLCLALDVNTYLIDKRTGINAGVEYLISKMFALRAGYKYHPDEIKDKVIGGLSLGFGFGMDGYCLDYAFVPYGELGDMHKISFSIKL